MVKKIITWDLGATKCAAALVEYDDQGQRFLSKKQGIVKIRSVNSLEELTAHLENILDIPMTEVDSICIGAAGQYDGEHLHLYKYPYSMGFAKLASQKNWPPFAVIHDYSSIVCATFTPYVEQYENVRRLNDAEMNPYGRRVALGIGTGIGMKDGILFSNGDFWLGTNEVGHIGVVTPPLADKIFQKRHEELLKFLRSEKILTDDEPLTFEKLLADQGMARIHAFFDRSAQHKNAEEVGELVRQGKANETLATFAWYVGLLVGTIQLTFMPDGGIWLTGGVILNHQELFDRPEFFQGIIASPEFLDLRMQFPLGLLCGTDHAFVGGAYYASKRLL